MSESGTDFVLQTKRGLASVCTQRKFLIESAFNWDGLECLGQGKREKRRGYFLGKKSPLAE